MLMWPVLGVGDKVTIDLSQWSEGLGSGGFADALSSTSDTDHVLKRMHDPVPEVNAINRMRQLSRHARVMGQRLDEILEAKPTAFVSYVCRSLRSTLTTHIGFSGDDEHIYLYQRKAAGTSLRELLADDMPPWHDRLQIARNFSGAMVAPGRCRVVHLDCSPDNVFADASDRYHVSLIDLDGCGVFASQEHGQRLDEWAIAPMTLGRPDETRPLWFPLDPEWQQPLSGSFRFAERWCVINEVWRILSWGGAALFWLDSAFNDLFTAHENVKDLFRDQSAGIPLDQKPLLLAKCQNEVKSKLEPIWNAAQNASFDPEVVTHGPVPARDQKFLKDFAKLTLISFFDPRAPAFIHFDPDLRGEMPNAKWTQDELIDTIIASRS